MKNLSNDNQWKRTLNGKLIVFWLFSIILPVVFLVLIAILSKYISMGNKYAIIPLVFAIIDLCIVIVDMIVVSKRDSYWLLIVFGIISILGIGLIIQGIFMILIADYVDINVKVVNNKNRNEQIKVGKIIDWSYNKYANLLTLIFEDKKIEIHDIKQDFITDTWSSMTIKEQTNYYIDHWMEE